MRLFRPLHPLTCAVAPLVLAGCAKEQAPQPNTPAVTVAAPDGSVSVTVVTPKRQSLAWAIDQPGSVLAFETTPVVAKLPGYVTKVHVDLGDKVVGPKFGPDGRMTQPGTLLAEMSIPELSGGEAEIGAGGAA